MEKVDNSLIQGRASTVLGVFAKAPVAGQVKTRLCPPLQPEQAAGLYQAILDETIQRFSGQSFDLVICYAGAEEYFANAYPKRPRQPQRGVDLGERMADALCSFLNQGYEQAVLIGSDSPDLPLSHVLQAFEALQHSEVVIAPAADGGYVLIGESRHCSKLFEQMPWSQQDLMQRTEQALASEQIVWHKLPPWEDVDDQASLARLLQRSPESRTAGYIRKHLAFFVA